jgi:hypothetical protein
MNAPRFPGLISSPAAVCPSMLAPLANTRFLKLCDALATCRQRCEGRGICPGLRKAVGSALRPKVACTGAGTPLHCGISVPSMSESGQTATLTPSALCLLPPTPDTSHGRPALPKDLAHPQEMPEISVQLGAWIGPPPPHRLSNIPSSPAAISGPLRPSLRRPSFDGTSSGLDEQRGGSRGAARSERALQVHEPSESPAAITTQPLVSAANTAVAIGSA